MVAIRCNRDGCDRCIFGVTPSFFRIILDPHAVVGIPPAFMECYGYDLSNPVVLKVPKGPAMDVQLVRSGKEAWLDEGWKRFSEKFSLGFDYVLLFYYKGTSQFDVVIFDKSCCEIQYTSPSNGPTEELEEETDEENSDGIGGTICNAYEQALAFKSTSCGQSFIVRMQRTYVSVSFILNISRKFPVKNCPQDGSVTLKIVSGQEWRVKCNVMRVAAKMTTGWRKFVTDNDIKEGDACVFEVVKEQQICMECCHFQTGVRANVRLL